MYLCVSPLRAIFQFAKPFGSYRCRPYCFSQGVHLSGAELKSWVPDTGYKPYAPQREASICEFPPGHGYLHQGWGLWGDCVSFSYPPRCTLSCLILRELFYVFSEGTAPYIAVDFLRPWEEVSSRSSYIIILDCLLSLDLQTKI